MLDLVSAFEALAPPETTGGAPARFSAIPIPDYEHHRLGKDPNGAPSLLVAAADSRVGGLLAPISLEHLAVQHDVACRITRPDGANEEGRFTVVRCTGGDHALQAYFLRVAAAIIALLGDRPSHAEISASIDRLVELFRSMNVAPRKSVQGLWAELLVMARIRNPAPLVAAWHTQLGDRYDFSSGSQRIEVKSATGRIRQHHFTLEQLLPVPGTQLLVASILVERAGAGTSIMDLVDEVRQRVSHQPHLLIHIDEIVVQTLGNSWRSAREERFDRQFGENSLAFFDPMTIPRVSADLPAGVSHVRFIANLSDILAVDTRKHRSEGGLFQSCLGR